MLRKALWILARVLLLSNYGRSQRGRLVIHRRHGSDLSTQTGSLLHVSVNVLFPSVFFPLFDIKARGSNLQARFDDDIPSSDSFEDNNGDNYDISDSGFSSHTKSTSRVRLSSMSESESGKSSSAFHAKRLNAGERLSLFLPTHSSTSLRVLNEQPQSTAKDPLSSERMYETERTIELRRENTDSRVSLLVLELIGIASLIALILIALLLRRLKYTLQHYMETFDHANYMQHSFDSSWSEASNACGEAVQMRFSRLVSVTPNGNAMFVL
ncbi:unnamed protein product [Albugo candida]|uniref:Uncharacterized protein n=1 Tax=Albugo candida TaxID=65357 RepID=A0A024GFD5_9STRA|nr:unnamed protein product [Albugo candida]|eukprot:CCI45594.1 unnamed protein product [Albugo candida]